MEIHVRKRSEERVRNHLGALKLLQSLVAFFNPRGSHLLEHGFYICLSSPPREPDPTKFYPHASGAQSCTLRSCMGRCVRAEFDWF